VTARRRATGPALLGLVALGVFALRAMPAHAAVVDDPNPTIGLSTASATPGGVIIVRLQGWTTATTVTICGNDGRRGAVDCDQIGGVGLLESSGAAEERELIVTLPPAPCPCVVRASSSGESLVRTVPIDIAGARSAPVVDGTPAPISNLVVDATIAGSSISLLDAIRGQLAGPVDKTLVLTLRNAGTVPLSGLSLSLAVGRSAQGGESVQAPNIDTLAPGQVRPYNIPIRLGAPAYGSYVAFGTVYGGGASVSFQAGTSNKPVILYLLILGLLIDVVAMAVLRIRRRAAGPAESAEAAPDVAPPSVVAPRADAHPPVARHPLEHQVTNRRTSSEQSAEPLPQETVRS
jgi:hypothetical protein